MIGGCVVIVTMALLIITVVCFKQKNKAKKKYAARHDSFNNYSDQPRRPRYYLIHMYNYVCTSYILTVRYTTVNPLFFVVKIFSFFFKNEFFLHEIISC